MTSTALRRTMFVVALAGILALAGIAAAASSTRVSTHGTSYGKILSNSRGFSLYMFAKDKQGGKGKSAKSTCYKQCAKVWPPLLVSKGSRVVASGGVNPKLLGTVRRSDGKVEVTYNGWPLYTYTPDTKPGKVSGQGASQFGAPWYLVNTRGQIVCPRGYNRSGNECLPGSY